MSDAGLQPVFETDALEEACADLVRVHELLHFRTGSLYARLMRDIEEQSCELFHAEPEIYCLGEGFFMYGPPKAMSALLRRARRLRLIR